MITNRMCVQNAMAGAGGALAGQAALISTAGLGLPAVLAGQISAGLAASISLQISLVSAIATARGFDEDDPRFDTMVVSHVVCRWLPTCAAFPATRRLSDTQWPFVSAADVDLGWRCGNGRPQERSIRRRLARLRQVHHQRPRLKRQGDQRRFDAAYWQEVYHNRCPKACNPGIGTCCRVATAVLHPADPPPPLFSCAARSSTWPHTFLLLARRFRSLRMGRCASGWH